MTDYYPKTPIRIPVRFVQGHWEYFYGGGVPVSEGALAELIVDKGSITDSKFLAALRKRSEHRMLDQGTRLRVALTIRVPLDAALSGLLIKMRREELSAAYDVVPRPLQTRFVEVFIGEPSPAFAIRRRDDVGGVWLQLDGTLPKGLVSSSVVVPKVISDTPLASLNHAFTRLSEEFEPWRKSHTGSIYTRIFYQERDGIWYPLERLRRVAEATEEESLIRERWQQIARMLSLETR